MPLSADPAFRALAEPKRRAMLRPLRDQPLPVNEIAAHFDITQQAVSQHLRVLHGAGLVVERRAGTRRLYVVRPDGLSDVQAFLDEFWPTSLQRLKTVVENDLG